MVDDVLDKLRLENYALENSRKKEKLSKSAKKEERTALLFILIPLIGFCIFTLISSAYSIYQSFTDYNPIRDSGKFVGFTNYINLFKNGDFLDAVANTVVLLLSIPLGITAGLLLAVYLKQLAHGSKLLSLLFYLPAVTSAVSICVVWQYMFNYEYGLINKMFNLHLNWFDNNDFFLIKIAIFIKGVWGGMGGTMILYAAGLNNVPDDYYECSDIDGASKWQQFIHITVPMVSPTTFYLVVTQIISHLQAYADAAIFTKGTKPAQTIIYYIWTYGIEDGKYGMASAAAVSLAIVIALVTIIQFKRSKMFDI